MTEIFYHEIGRQRGGWKPIWNNCEQFGAPIRFAMRRRDEALGPKMGLCYDHSVRVIALSAIKAFLNRSAGVADAREPVMAWYRQVKQADWAKPADVKRDLRSASILQDGRVVFNIAGNKYRIVVWINYPYRVVYIRFIGTHRQHDAIDAQSI
jgi:mRNA interferase HigB